MVSRRGEFTGCPGGVAGCRTGATDFFDCSGILYTYNESFPTINFIPSVQRMPKAKTRTKRDRRKRRPRQTRRSRVLARRQRGGGDEPPLTYTPPEGRAPITVFTLATQRKEPLNHLLRSLQKHKYNYQVLEFGKPWGGWQRRIECYRDAVASLNPEEVAICLDAYDMLCIKDSDKVLKTYMERPRKHLPVVYAVEWVCYGNCSKEVLKWFDVNKVEGVGGSEEIKAGFTPESVGTRTKDWRPVFVNGGFICGVAGKMKEYFTLLLQGAVHDDQVAAADWIANNLDKNLVDLNVEESLVRVNLERTKEPQETGGEEGPAFLHFSGMQGNEEETLRLFAMYEGSTS